MIYFIFAEYYSSLIKIILSRWMQVLSRLTYRVYLIHEVIHIFQNGRVRTARVFSFIDIVRMHRLICKAAIILYEHYFLHVIYIKKIYIIYIKIILFFCLHCGI
jgi:hypothetical protein